MSSTPNDDVKMARQRLAAAQQELSEAVERRDAVRELEKKAAITEDARKFTQIFSTPSWEDISDHVTEGYLSFHTNCNDVGVSEKSEGIYGAVTLNICLGVEKGISYESDSHDLSGEYTDHESLTDVLQALDTDLLNEITTLQILRDRIKQPLALANSIRNESGVKI